MVSQKMWYSSSISTSQNTFLELFSDEKGRRRRTARNVHGRKSIVSPASTFMEELSRLLAAATTLMTELSLCAASAMFFELLAISLESCANLIFCSKLLFAMSLSIF
jgi:hypothetical protein